MNDWPQGQRKSFKDEQGATKVAGMLRNEPGACEYSAPFFYSCYPSRQFFLLGCFMTTHDRVRFQLQALEAYCVNISTGETMNPSRINLIVPTVLYGHHGTTGVVAVGADPRMHDLLENNQPLPGAFAVAPIMKWRWRRTTRNARLFWLSGKTGCSFCG